MSLFIDNVLTNLVNKFISYSSNRAYLERGFVPPLISSFSEILNCIEPYQIDYFIKNEDDINFLYLNDLLEETINMDGMIMFKHMFETFRTLDESHFPDHWKKRLENRMYYCIKIASECQQIDKIGFLCDKLVQLKKEKLKSNLSDHTI